ncbi:hypothetical protein [Streptomyces sp. NPDC058632]|uniref:hypothetical protein n=1 Tax=unclassified Streptomyces TaxID=2593676 RepID=UPI0036552C39
MLMTTNGSHIHQPPHPEITRLSRQREGSSPSFCRATPFRTADRGFRLLKVNPFARQLVALIMLNRGDLSDE